MPVASGMRSAGQGAGSGCMRAIVPGAWDGTDVDTASMCLTGPGRPPMGDRRAGRAPRPCLAAAAHAHPLTCIAALGEPYAPVSPGCATRAGRCIESDSMPKLDELLVAIAALVESGQSNQMSLTVVTSGAVITGRLAPEAMWKQRVSEVLADSADLGEFSAVFDTPARKDGPPTHLHFHVARILQGTVGIPETGGMYRVAIEDVSAWTVGDFSYSDH